MSQSGLADQEPLGPAAHVAKVSQFARKWQSEVTKDSEEEEPRFQRVLQFLIDKKGRRTVLCCVWGGHYSSGGLLSMVNQLPTLAPHSASDAGVIISYPLTSRCDTLLQSIPPLLFI